MQESINQAINICHNEAVRNGWWNDPKTGKPVERNKGELIALMHSELSKCLEGVRKNLMDNHLKHRTSEEVKLAGAVMRIFDYAGKYNLDLGGAIKEKLVINASRDDHKPENRIKENGKAF